MEELASNQQVDGRVQPLILYWLTGAMVEMVSHLNRNALLSISRKEGFTQIHHVLWPFEKG